MKDTVTKQIMKSIVTASGLYHKLVLLVGQSGSGKTQILREVAEALGIHLININYAISSELLELTTMQRSLRLPGLLSQISENAPTLLVLDNIEILFDKDLKQDPLRLLQGVSRNRTVVAAWNGTFIEGRLQYAAIGHPEYRSYEAVDAQIICIEDSITGDSLRHNGKAGQV